MILPNRSTACRHIELQDGCGWCDVYKHHAIRKCDRCQQDINTDAVYLALTDPRPQLICAGCHLWESNTKGVK